MKRKLIMEYAVCRKVHVRFLPPMDPVQMFLYLFLIAHIDRLKAGLLKRQATFLSHKIMKSIFEYFQILRCMTQTVHYLLQNRR